MTTAIVAACALLAVVVVAAVAHDVARRWFADRADARAKRVALDATALDELREELASTKKLTAEHHRVLAALATKGRRL